MTLFEELGVEYKEVDGILYPLLSVDEAEYNLTDIGKYGRMILSILVYTFFTRMFDFMLPLVVKYSIVAA